ncbi:metal-dependent transcriptional regulator [Luteimicrobium subarcticum]|uniref:Manganese transport regulator n=1 Tax=Luteimicrobium subarcticum TaxID=620910 RepID=A0A2M8WQV7_9MICO|nr:metal-dependent transcriptional regulator [Luteimicrobium subarcticum]PJI93329.1 DtxR family iron (metal) dependent repressor [Luteimicrobium subarcticum]
MSHSTDGLSAVAQDYLKVVWSAQEWSDDPVTTKLLAERMGVGASTVSETVRRLSDQGLLSHERYGAISLTDDGRRHALAMVRRHRLMETFLVETLGYSWDEVHDEAEVLEHAVSDDLVARIAAHLGHPERDPHGDPIPRADGTVPATGAVSLVALPAGASGTVSRISDADPDVLRYLTELGLHLDTPLRVVGRREYAGVLEVTWQEGRIAQLGFPAAEAIWVVPSGGDATVTAAATKGTRSA